MTEAHVAQLSVSPGGLPKRAVAEALVTRLGLAGDTQRNLEHDRVALGENVTTAGLDWSVVVPGARLRLGPGVLLEVTTFTSPCFNLAPLFRHRDFGRVSQKRHPGWSRVYARVLAEGAVHPGDPVHLVSEPAITP